MSGRQVNRSARVTLVALAALVSALLPALATGAGAGLSAGGSGSGGEGEGAGQAFGAALAMAAGGLAAQIPEGVEGEFRPHPEAERAISRLLSPFCPGLMLEVCPSPAAAALRDSMQAMAVEGRSADELVAWMLANHGENYRAIPERRGAGLWAWVMPPLAIALGLLLVVLLLRKLRRSGPPAPSRSTLSAEERERVEAALREMDLTEGAP